MRITDMAAILMNTQQFQKQKSEPRLPNGSLPPKGHVNPYEDPYLDVTGKDPSEWSKVIPVDDEVAGKIRALVKESFIKRNGMSGIGADADKEANIIKSYIATLPGEQKLAAIYSCQRIGDMEADRLAAKIREQNPTWQYGQAFDTDILSKDFDIKV